MNNTIKLCINWGDIMLATSGMFACYYSVREAAEVLHDLMRSSDKLAHLSSMRDTRTLYPEETANTLEDSELTLEISSSGGAISTLDELIGHVWQAIDTCQSRNEDTLRMLHFRLLCEAHADDAHYVDRIPSSWLSWLVNADATGMSDDEWTAARSWETDHELVAYSTSEEDLLCDTVPVLVRKR